MQDKGHTEDALRIVAFDLGVPLERFEGGTHFAVHKHFCLCGD
jgi:hypothetical protein